MEELARLLPEAVEAVKGGRCAVLEGQLEGPQGKRVLLSYLPSCLFHLLACLLLCPDDREDGRLWFWEVHLLTIVRFSRYGGGKAALVG